METTTTTISAIYNKFHNEILYYVSQKVNNFDVAQEIANDVFVKADKHLENFDETKSQLRTWLYNIAKNTIIDFYRSDRSNNYMNVGEFVNEKGEETFNFVADNRTDKAVENKELKAEIMKAFNSMKPKYQRIAILFFLEEKKMEEIANICEVPIGTVKGMIFRCREQLQSQLKQIYVG